MTPMPPRRAIWIAILAVVTVSMAAEMMGVSSSMRRDRRVRVEASDGMTSVLPGSRRTSS